MQALIDAVRASIAQQNWYAALAVALALPDICGRATAPTRPSGARYAEWFERFVGDKYRKPDDTHGVVTFLSGNDCYALRCAFLHEGSDDTSRHKAREALERFHVYAPGRGKHNFHCNRRERTLQVQVDLFCADIADGAEEWLNAVAGDADVVLRLSGILQIRDTQETIAFLLS